jgi:hypothetical protein
MLILKTGIGLLLALGTLMSLNVSMPGWGWTLVAVTMAGLFAAALAIQQWRKRRAFHLAEQAHHLRRLMDVAGATENLDQCLSSRSCPEPVRAMGLVELGHICLATGEPRSAEIAFEHALAHRGLPDTEWLWRAEIGLAEAKLRCQQLSDAHTTIRRLTCRDLPPAWQSRVQLLRCLQRLLLGNARDLAERSNDLWHEFRRYLGVDAGYGYGLLAAALDRCGQAAGAIRFWHDATLLIRPERLVQRYPELRALALKYEASTWPW